MIWTREDVLTAMSLHSLRVQCVVRHEIGGVGYSPYAISEWGDMGPAQINPHGKLRRFLAAGYTDVFNPFQALDFLESELPLDPGAWTPVRQGLC